MPVSWVSDFEHFAQKVKKQIGIKVKRVEESTSDYLLQTENEAVHKIDSWLKHAQDEWDQERYIQKQQNRNSTAEEVNRKWSEFKKERKLTLTAVLKVRLERIFPLLVECFVSQLLQKYQSGTFMMPEAYIPLVASDGFILHSCKKEQIVFTSGNLYIEYSVERIIEELDDEINSHMVDKWQA